MRGPGELLDVPDALERVLAACTQLGAEDVALSAAAGRVLAADVVSDVDVPPFDRCAMDGYAVRSADASEAPTSLKVVGRVLAGEVRTEKVEAGQAVQVMTGAPLPPGCDAVQPVERVRLDGSRVVVHDRVEAGQHVAPRGEDLRRGDVALARGTLIGPAEIGLLATTGHAEVSCHARPLATVAPTGDELVEVGETPGPAQLRNSNGPMLAVLARELGCDPVQLMPSVSDSTAALEEALERGLRGDVLLLSGGVSRGERDLVGDVLESLGVERILHGVAVQPGKPIWFGRRGQCLVFGLPGNPVSALVTGRIFAGPAIRRLRGLPAEPPRRLPAKLTRDHRRRAKREGWLPARVVRRGDDLACEPLSPRGSADLVTAAAANALWIAPVGADVLHRGASVDVLLHPDWAERPVG